MATTKQLISYKKKLTQKGTGAEVRAKELLSSKYEFPKEIQEQCIFGHYILDFVIPEKMLAVEIDGGIHSTPTRLIRDRRRDKFLAKYGLMTLRIKNEDVETVLERVAAFPNVVGWRGKWILGLGAASVPQANLNKVLTARAKKAPKTKKKRKK